MDDLEPIIFPEPIISDCGHLKKRPRDDFLLNLSYLTYEGWRYCQEALVGIDLIHPYSDWVPDIDEETRAVFKKSVDENKPIPITLYEKDGKLIMSDDYELYYLYREFELYNVSAVIVGQYTENKYIGETKKPYKVKRPKEVFKVL